MFWYSLTITSLLMSSFHICVADNFEGPNIALNQTASQLPGVFQTNYAHLAVDGNIKNNLLDVASSCAHTDFSDTAASWTVKLDQAYNITGISLLNRKAIEWRIRLKNFKVLGDGQELYGNQETTGSCLNTRYSGTRPVPSFCDETVLIPINATENIMNVTILVNAHQNDSSYPDNGIFSSDAKRAILTLCEVEIFATVCLPDITIGHVAAANPYTTPGSTGTFKCNEGYRPSDSVVTCTVTREWSPLPTCSIVHCAFPGDFGNGIYTNEDQVALGVNTSLPYLSKVFVKCNLGYEQTGGSLPRQCLADGTWNGSRPVCEPVQCQYPGEIVNGWYTNVDNGEKYTSGSLPYLSVITAVCNEGYESSSVTRSCQANKVWSGKASTCNLVYCSPPNNVNNGHYIFQENASAYFGNASLEYGTNLTATCYLGYTLRSGFRDITCKSDSTWTKPDPLCEMISCSVPSTSPGVQRQFSVLINGKTVPFNATMNETCAENYQSDMTQVVRRCTEIGEFDGSAIICEAVNHQSTSLLGAAVGGSAGALVVIIIVLVVIIFVQRRRLSGARDKNANDGYENAIPLPDTNPYSEIRASQHFQN